MSVFLCFGFSQREAHPCSIAFVSNGKQEDEELTEGCDHPVTDGWAGFVLVPQMSLEKLMWPTRPHRTCDAKTSQMMPGPLQWVCRRCFQMSEFILRDAVTVAKSSCAGSDCSWADRGPICPCTPKAPQILLSTLWGGSVGRRGSSLKRESQQGTQRPLERGHRA